MHKEKLSDLWSTPKWLFDKLANEFNFSIDLCANFNNRKTNIFCNDFFNITTAYLSGETGFLNPPYSNLYPFVNHAWELSRHAKIVCLLKNDPSTKWWGIFWDFKTQQPKAGCAIRYPSYDNKNQGRRVKFDPPPKHVLEDYLENGSEKDKKLARSLLDGKITTPAFPSAIVVMDRRFIGGNNE